jgi:WD40 repeat protein
VISVCFLGPTGRRLAAACGDGRVRVWDVERAAVVREFVVVRGPLRVVSSPDGSKLAVCRNGDQLTPGQRSLARQARGPALLFDLGSTSDAPVDELGEDVWNAAFSLPDGDALLTAESDGMARLWDLRSGSLLREFGPHESQVIAVAFAPPHGDRVLTVSRAQVARIWSAADGKLRATLRGHTGTVWSGAFSADGKRAATASTDHTVRVWIVDEEELIRAASDRQLEVRPEQLVPYADLLDDGR